MDSNAKAWQKNNKLNLLEIIPMNIRLRLFLELESECKTNKIENLLYKNGVHLTSS